MRARCFPEVESSHKEISPGKAFSTTFFPLEGGRRRRERHRRSSSDTLFASSSARQNDRGFIPRRPMMARRHVPSRHHGEQLT